MSSQDVPPGVPANADSNDSWDPYDVWLKRVQQPRDRQSRRPSIIQPALLASPEFLGELEPKPQGAS
ncbi:MAG: hypothetical protein ACR2I8_00780 [Steroidobacteraceae bacterium]